MPKTRAEVYVACGDFKRVGNVQHRMDLDSGRLAGRSLVGYTHRLSLFPGPADTHVRRPVVQPLADACLGVPAERTGAHFVARLGMLQAEIELIALLAVLHLETLVQQEVIIARTRGIIVVGRTVGIEGGLVIAPLLPARIYNGREPPVLPEGLQIRQLSADHLAAAAGVVMQVPRRYGGPIPGPGVLPALSEAPVEVVVDGQVQAAPLLADVPHTAGYAAAGLEGAG